MKTLVALAVAVTAACSVSAFAQTDPAQSEPLVFAALDEAQSAPAPRRQVLRQATVERGSRATPQQYRVYEDRHTSLSMSLDPRYECEHGSDGNAISCWCNWNEDANDCKNMILNSPCGEDGAWWTSNVPGEYGCDTQ